MIEDKEKIKNGFLVDDEEDIQEDEDEVDTEYISLYDDLDDDFEDEPFDDDFEGKQNCWYWDEDYDDEDF